MADARNILEEQLAKGGRLPTALPWQLFTFSLIIFLAALAVYLGMDFGYKPYLQSQVKNLDSKINNLGNAVNQDQQNTLVGLYSQLTNIKTLLASHITPSKIFDELEKTALTQVYYTDLDLTLSQNKLGLKGVAPTFGALTQQLESLKQNDLFGDVLLENAKISTDGVSFSIQITLKPNALK